MSSESSFSSSTTTSLGPPFFTYQQGETAPKDVSNVKFDANVTQIEKGAFEGCFNLKKIIIPKGVTEIKDDAFKNCENLTEVELPDSLESIGKEAFCKCSSLTEIKLPNALSFIGEGAFKICSNLASINLPKGVESIGKYTFYSCSNLTSIGLPDNVTSIGIRAFSKCLRLNSIILPKGVESIEDSVFSFCSSLTSMKLPDNIISIGTHAFSSCSSLINIGFNDKVISIGKYAFFYCTNLRSIDLPSSVTSIGDGVFSSCSNLLRMKLPDDLCIGGKAFSNCNNVRSVILPLNLMSNEDRTIEGGTFEGCSKLISVSLPKNLKYLGKHAFKRCSSLQNIILPEEHTPDFIRENNLETDPGCFQNSSVVFQDLKDHNDFADWLENRNEEFPLHSICSTIYDGPDDLITNIEQCLQDYPGCAEKKDKFKQTPLHVLALNPKVTKESLKPIIRAYPEALFSKDDNGMLPQHSLLLNPNLCADLFMQGVLNAKQKNKNYAISMNNADYHSVSSYAIHLNCDEDVQYLLYSHHPVDRKGFREMSVWYYPQLQQFEQKYINEIKKKDKKWTHLDEHAWVHFLDILSNAQNSSGEVLSFIKSEECDRKYVEKLAYAKDQDDRVALNVANKELQDAMKEKMLLLGRYQITSTLHQSDTCIVKKAIDMNSDLYYSSVFNKLTKSGSKVLDNNQVKEALEYLGINNGDDKVTELVKIWGVDQNHFIDKEEFLEMCKDELDNGPHRYVALKFMKNKDEFDREKDIRKNLNDDGKARKYFVDVEDHKNMEEAHCEVWTYEKELEPYKFLLIMNLADRDLEEIIRSEQLNEKTKEGYLFDLIDCLEYIHSKGIIHGDLKPSNIVRYKGTLRLIDFDASSYICKLKETKESKFYTGKKFSSGTLPPQMIFECKDENDTSKFEEYFAAEASKNDALWDKLKPKQSQVSRRVFVVKSFLTKSENKKDPMGKEYEEETVKEEGLPDNYVLEKAAVANDMWALGSIVYYMHTGQTLFDVDINDNLKNGRAMGELRDWIVDGNNLKLENVKKMNMKRLLVSLLSEDLKERVSAIKAKNIINEEATDLKKIKKIVQMENEKLIKLMFEATSVNIPTCFIIVPYKIHEITSAKSITEEMFDFGKAVANKVHKFIDEKGILPDILNQYTQKTYYLYLIDEWDNSVIAEAQGPYPIEIKDSPKYMENAMAAVLTAMKVLNNVGKFATLFFPLVPQIPNKFIDGIENNFNPEKNPFSLENNDKITSDRGKELGEFQKFLERKDPDRHFCDLIRVANLENSKAMWVSQKSLDEMEKKNNVQYKKDSEDLNNRKKLQEKSKEIENTSEDYEKLKSEHEQLKEKIRKMGFDVQQLLRSSSS